MILMCIWCGVRNCHGCPSVSILSLLWLSHNSLTHQTLHRHYLPLHWLPGSDSCCSRSDEACHRLSSIRADGWPACVTSLYAASREHQLIHGDLIYVVLLLISAVTFSSSFSFLGTCVYDTQMIYIWYILEHNRFSRE